MAQISVKHFRIGTIIAVLFLTILACNAPVSQPTETPGPTETSAEPAAVDSPQVTLGAPETIPAVMETESSDTAQDTPKPTFTAINQPTLIPTRTSSPTRVSPTNQPQNDQGTTAPKISPEATENGGPLTFDYHISWRFKEGNAQKSIATVTITAKGGGGDYTYYRDGFVVDGPQFEYEWSSCSGNPGTFRVTSADGQSRDKQYYSDPPCPTPEP
jgi:hypothetical protein